MPTLPKTLGWLINPQDKQVEVYRQNSAVEIVYNPQELSGEPTLPKFTLDLTDIFG